MDKTKFLKIEKMVDFAMPEIKKERVARLRKIWDSYGFFPHDWGSWDSNGIIVSEEEFQNIMSEKKAEPKYKRTFQYF